MIEEERKVKKEKKRAHGMKPKNEGK